MSVNEGKKRSQSITHRQIKSVLHNPESSRAGLAPNTSRYPAAFIKVGYMYNIYQLIVSGAIKALELDPGKMIQGFVYVQCVYLRASAWFLLFPLVLCWFGSRVLSVPPSLMRKWWKKVQDGHVGKGLWAHPVHFSPSPLPPAKAHLLPQLGKVQAPCPALAPLVLLPQAVGDPGDIY